MKNKNTNEMTQKELESELAALELLRAGGNLTPQKAKRIQEIRSALYVIECSNGERTNRDL